MNQLNKSIDLSYTDTAILVEALKNFTKSDGSIGTYAEGLLARLVEYKDGIRLSNNDGTPISKEGR